MVVSRTVRENFDPQICGSVTFIEPEQLGFYATRKRLLVNSVHYVFALFCVELIIEEGLHQRDQFLKMLVPHLEREPKYVHAQNVYCRIQALRLMWPLFTEPDSEDAKALTKCYGAVAPQELFDVMIHEVKEVQVRMIEPADTVGCLIDPANLRKELRKWKEHQREPIEFVRKYEHDIRLLSLYDKLSVEDMKALESVLSDAFVGLSNYLLT